MRKKIRTVIFIIFGPIALVVGIFSVQKDLEFAKSAVPVRATIVSQERVPVRKGPDEMKYVVNFQAPETPGQTSQGTFKVMESKHSEVIAKQPLELRYLASDPAELRYPGSMPMGWLPLVIGIAISLMGVYGFHTWGD